VVAGRSDLELHVATTADSRGLKKAADDIDDTKKSSDKLGDSFKDTGKESGHLEDGIRQLEEHIRSLGQEFGRTGDKDVFKQIRKDRGELGNLKKIRAELDALGDEVQRVGREGTKAGEGLLGGLSGLGDIGGPLKGVGIGVLVAGIAGATPAIAAMLEGALSGTVVGGAMAAGLIAASRDSTVRSAASEFGDVVSREFWGAGNAFVGPAIESLHTLGDAIQDLHLADALGKAAPYVKVVAEGLADMGRNIMPGLDKLLDRSGAFSITFADGLANIGAAMGDFLDEVSSGPGALAGLEAGLNLLANTITLTGRGLHTLGEIFVDFLKKAEYGYETLAELSDVLGFHGTAEGLRTIRDGIDNLVTGADTAQRRADTLAHVVEYLGGSTADTTANFRDLNRELNTFFRDSMDASKAADNYQAALDKLTDSVRENGTTTDANTEKGRANREAVRDLVEAAIRLHDANVAAGQSTKDADAAYEAQIAKIEALAKKLHLSKDAVAELIDAYKRLPGTIAAAARAAEIAADIAITAAKAQASALAFRIQGQKGGGQYQGHAAGGSVMAGVPSWVGERGPELFIPATSGRIMSNTASMAYAGGGAPQVSARPLVININGNAAMAALMRELRNEIQAQGGTLAVLGIRS
jgi:hypothetical protein